MANKIFRTNINSVSIEEIMNTYNKGYIFEINDGKKAKIYKQNKFFVVKQEIKVN